MKIRHQRGLTFDDVLLVPARSAISSRQDVSTSTRLTCGIRLNIPVISANMDTVTEEAMAVAMAENGGIGIVHRFMSIEHQVQKIRYVKRCQGFIVENPYEIGDGETIETARTAAELPIIFCKLTFISIVSPGAILKVNES